MPDVAKITIDDSRMQEALKALLTESKFTHEQFLTVNARQFLKTLAYLTPKRSGAARAGWTAGWKALGINGRPYTSRDPGQSTKKRSEVRIDGSVNDHRKDTSGKAYIEFSNRTESRRITKKGGTTAWVRYIYMVNARKNFVGEAVRRTGIAYWELYQKRLAKHSAR